MKKIYLVFILLASTVLACQATTSAPAAPQTPLNNTATPTQPPLVPSSTATLLPSPAPTVTATATPQPLIAVIGPENFAQLQEIQVYGGVFEGVIGNALLEEFGTQLGEGRITMWTYSPDGRYLAVGGCTTNWSGTCHGSPEPSHSFLYILDAATAELVGEVPENDGTITGLAFTPDGSRLVYAMCPFRAAVWNIELQEVEQVFWQERGCDAYPRLAVSPDGNQVAVASDSRLLVFDLTSGDQIALRPGQGGGTEFPKYSADGSRLATFSATSGRAINVYDTSTWSILNTINFPGGGIGAVDFSPDGRWIVTAEQTQNPEIVIWDASTGTQAAVLEDEFYYIDSLAFTPDGRLLFAGGYMEDYNNLENLSVWDMDTRQRLGTLSGYFPPNRIMFAGDGMSFITNGSTLWSMPDESMLAARQAVTGLLDGLANGDYEAAAQWFQPLAELQDALLASGFDPSDMPGYLEAICAQPHQPCMPLDQIVYAGKVFMNEYLFEVTFTAPDGTLYQGTDHETTFWLYVDSFPDGSMKVSYLPYFFLTP